MVPPGAVEASGGATSKNAATGVSWTEERLALFSDLQPGGMSYGLIAVRLNLLPGPVLTRNAVCGKAHRMGLSVTPAQKSFNQRRNTPKPDRPVRIAKPKAPPKRKNNPWAAVNVVRKAERLARDAERNKLPEERIRDATFARPWTERKPGQCAFPISGTGDGLLSCCAPAERTYCEPCEAVMYQPRQPTMKKTMRIARIAA